MAKKIITNLDSSKISGSDCNPVVILKNCEHVVSYILVELFNTPFPNLFAVTTCHMKKRP